MTAMTGWMARAGVAFAGLAWALAGCTPVDDGGGAQAAADAATADAADVGGAQAGDADATIDTAADAASDETLPDAPAESGEDGPEPTPDVAEPDASRSDAADGGDAALVADDGGSPGPDVGPEGDAAADGPAEDVTGEADSGPDAPFSCGADLEACGEDCVDLDTHFDHCGACDRPCEEGEICETRECVAQEDCRTDGCPPDYYCNLGDGLCRLGCAQTADCGPHEVCDPLDHACVCADDYHRCGSDCVSDDEPAHCGERCSACPGTLGGQAECVAETCGLSCHAGYRLCDGDCRSCPTDGVTATTCAGSTCQASACDAGHRLCGGSCAPCPDEAGIATTTCQAGACVVQACEPDYRLCDGSCSPCPGDVAGTTCLAGGCAELACTGGRPCDSGCCPWEASFIQENTSMYDNELAALAVDPSGTPHIMLSSRPTFYGRLDYALPDGDGWTLEEVYEETNSVQPTVSIVLAGSTPHVAFDANAALYHAIAGDEWDPAQLLYTPQGNWPGEPEIARTSDGRMHIVSSRDGEIDHYSYRNGSYTYLPELEIGADIEELELAPFGTGLRMTYQVDFNYAVGYRTYTPESGWSAVSYIPRNNDGHSHALAVDSAGNPHVTHYSNAYLLRYSQRTGASWATETVADGFYSALALDAGDRPHVCYTGPPDGSAGTGLHYAYRTAEGWVTQELADGAAVSCAIALDATGSPHIVAVLGTPSAREAWYFH